MALAKPRPKRNSSEDPDEFRLTLGEHLEELRGRLFRVIGVLAVTCIAGWFVALPLYSVLSDVVANNLPKDVDFKEPFTSITQPFMLQLKLAFYSGLAVAFPYLGWELWGFVAPGLKASERRPVRLLAPFSAGLFLCGCGLGWLTLPAAFQWFAGFFKSFPNTALYQEPGTMVFLIVKLVLAFGVAFQLPVVTFFLTRIGIISPAMLSQYWRQAIVAVFALSAVLTPSGDPFTMLAMAVPLIVLFFGSVFAVKLTTKSGGRDPVLNDLD